jgi:hypothetical protein
MTARAEMQVFEGVPVHVSITGRTSGTDLMTIDLSFDGVQAALGPHHVTFSLPEGGAHVANGNLDGNWYYSQGGESTLSVSPDGQIDGTFDIALAHGEMGGPDEPLVFAPDAVAMPLVGQFSGRWVLDCHSRLAGHQSFMAGGDFCEGLDL